MSELYTYNARIGRVVDGDTVDVLIDCGFEIFHKARIRLIGIDAAEIRTRDVVEKTEGLRAKAWLMERLGKKAILKTEYDSKGKYGRILGTFFVDGVNINEEMIEIGLAKRYGS